MPNNYRLEINRIFRAPKYTEGDNNLTDAVTRVYYSWVAESEEGIIKKIQYTRDLNPSNDSFIEFSKSVVYLHQKLVNCFWHSIES